MSPPSLFPAGRVDRKNRILKFFKFLKLIAKKMPFCVLLIFIWATACEWCYSLKEQCFLKGGKGTLSDLFKVKMETMLFAILLRITWSEACCFLHPHFSLVSTSVKKSCACANEIPEVGKKWYLWTWHRSVATCNVSRDFDEDITLTVSWISYTHRSLTRQGGREMSAPGRYETDPHPALFISNR